ncbi:hypothetical protein AEGHOMDF_5660 [Methylobacterium soli]|nr:hypothetical protein AEGHOMDF_5660 [Methylobacterium soli]
MAWMKSGCWGESGAEPMPSTILCRSNPTVWALCRATSRTRATTWVEPASDCVGAKMKVTSSGRRPAASATLATTEAGGPLAASSTRAVRVAESR